MKCALIVPLKAFSLAKGRLAGALSDDERATLARRCAAAVIGAAGEWPVYVVTNDDDVARWARTTGARIVTDAGSGLDAAVDAGRRAAVADGAAHVVVAHGDLPLARRLNHVVVAGAVTLVPDRRRDGTNVLAVPAGCPFTTSYGPGSFERHREGAERAGLDVRVIDDPDLALDLDTVDDLAELASRPESAVDTGASR